MSARAATDDTDVIRIDLQALRIRTQPAHRCFAVVEVLRPRRLLAFLVGELVVDAHADVAIERERGADVDLACGTLLTAGPTAAVNDQHGGEFLPGLRIRRQIQVRLLFATTAEVIDVVLGADVISSDGCGGEEEKEEVLHGERVSQ